MKNLSALRECIKGLVLEGYYDKPKNWPKPVFELIDPVHMGAEGTEFYIAREFPMQMSPENLAVLGIDPADTNNGIFDEEFEMTIHPDVDYSPGQRGNTYGHADTWSPDDPEQFEIDEYVVVTIRTPKGHIGLSKEDGIRLAEYLGHLTDNEMENIRDQFMDGMEPPDPPSGRGDW